MFYICEFRTNKILYLFIYSFLIYWAEAYVTAVPALVPGNVFQVADINEHFMLYFVVASAAVA